MMSPANESDAYIPLANRHCHPHSKHDYSYLCATLLGKVFDHSDCLGESEYLRNVLGENDYAKRFLNDCLRSPVCRTKITQRVIPLLRVMQ